MVQILSKFTLLDKENEVVELSYYVDDVQVASINFDFLNNVTEVTGDLYNLIGFGKTENDKENYNKYISLQMQFAKTVLERY
jgi:hypothetical protein